MSADLGIAITALIDGNTVAGQWAALFCQMVIVYQYIKSRQ